MPTPKTTAVNLLAGLVLLLSPGTGCSADEPTNTASPTGGSPDTLPPRLSVEAARQQAVSLHEIIHSTLRVTHDRYYREDEGLPIPASILKEVFSDVKRTRNITLRWLAVDGQAMNTDHKPQDAFERQAVKSLKSGKPAYESGENGVYRRAAAITLSNHCLKCHVPDRRSTHDRTAGLIVSIPVK